MTRTKNSYISYSQAKRSLAERFSASPEEIAVWIYMAPKRVRRSKTGKLAKRRGIAAYSNANEFDHPPRFFFSEADGCDYIAPLMRCWFRAADVASFTPLDRYLTGKSLINRWNSLGDYVIDFIRARIEESRLIDLHPTMGATQWTENEDIFPSRESALFALAQVEAIENEDGIGTAEPPNERAQPKLQAQETAILKALRDLGYNPRKLPKAAAGKPGAKKQIKHALSASPLFNGTTTFTKAWDRLRGLREIADGTPNPLLPPKKGMGDRWGALVGEDSSTLKTDIVNAPANAGKERRCSNTRSSKHM